MAVSPLFQSMLVLQSISLCVQLTVWATVDTYPERNALVIRSGDYDAVALKHLTSVDTLFVGLKECNLVFILGND